MPGAAGWSVKFRSTPPHGGRPPIDSDPVSGSGFDPRPRTGGDQQRHFGTSSTSGLSRFRSTPPHGGRRAAHGPALGERSFDPRPRTGGDSATCLACATDTQSFDPRPRTGGDALPRSARTSRLVSIHAPARGATWRNSSVTMVRVVSIHAPARGATNAVLEIYPGRRSFDPRPRTGGDMRAGFPLVLPIRFDPRPRTGGDVHQGLSDGCIGVSIHAPARGATRVERRLRVGVHVSIHAPARGATACSPAPLGVYVFRSTPPHGGRLRSFNFMFTMRKERGLREPGRQP